MLIPLLKLNVQLNCQNKLFHSIEMTLLALVAAVIDAFAGDLIATRILVAALLIFAIPATIGHAVAILSSNRLKAAP